MTQPHPRIYTYRVTFVDVPFFYYGVHKESKFGEAYTGSPVSNKWVWSFYEPQVQILEFFDDWETACDVEQRLIREFYNSDPNCLNRHCGGHFSLETCRANGKEQGMKNKQLGRGICGLSDEERKHHNSNAGRVSSKKNKYLQRQRGLEMVSNKEGLFSQSTDQLKLNGRKGGKKAAEINRKNGFFGGITKEERSKMNEGSKNPRAKRIKVGDRVFNCMKHAYEFYGVSKPTFKKRFQYEILS